MMCRPLNDPSSAARVALGNALASLPCAIFHDSSLACGDPQRKPAVSTIPVCLRVGSCLLDGTGKEVTSAVRRVAYEALSRSIRHHTTGFGGRRVDHASEFISRGLKDQDRTVRLSAGSVLLLPLLRSVNECPCIGELWLNLSGYTKGLEVAQRLGQSPFLIPYCELVRARIIV